MYFLTYVYENTANSLILYDGLSSYCLADFVFLNYAINNDHHLKTALFLQ